VSEEYLLQGGRPPSWTTSSGWFRLPNVPQPTPPADPSNCASCGKGMEIVGLNQTYPPKRDPNGHAICPHCGRVGVSTGILNEGPSPAMRANPMTARGTLARLALDMAQDEKFGSTLFGDAPGREQWVPDADLPAIFSMMDYDDLSPIQLSLLWAAEGCTCFNNRPGPYNPCEMHGNAGGVGSPTDERGLWLLKDSIRKPGTQWKPSTELAALTVDMDAHFRLLMDDIVKQMAKNTANAIVGGNDV